jgi:starch synthase
LYYTIAPKAKKTKAIGAIAGIGHYCRQEPFLAVSHPLKVLMAAPEIAPLAKTGGLGDVTGSLPPALSKLGLDVRLAMPFYRQTKAAAPRAKDTGLRLTVPTGLKPLSAEVWRTDLNGCPVYLIKQDTLFDRGGLYQGKDGDFPDNARRFIYFSQAVIELARALEFSADIVHLHDWQTGLIPAYLRSRLTDPGPLAGAKSLLTIHNLAFQGIFGREVFAQTGLPPEMNSIGGVEFWGNISFLKAGLVFSDALTTVSPNYAREIQTPEGGMGMEGILASRQADLRGILNGADYTNWSPESDPLLPVTYTVKDLSGKETCRQALCQSFELEAPGPQTAVAGFVGRLAWQKGMDILAEAAPRFLLDDVRLCILGTGEPHLEAQARELAKAYPGRVGVKLVFSEELAHLVQAGADLLVMPSRFEPCGLNQIYALKYGTAPVVHATGGLKDTVEPFNPLTGRGTGFVFERPTPHDLLSALREALWSKARPHLWRQLQQNAMRRDFSWSRSALKYTELYQSLAGG